MTRRFTFAIVGAIAATLLLAGLGTLLLSRFENRQATARDLGAAANAIAGVLDSGSNATNRRGLPQAAIPRIGRALSIEGVGYVVIGRVGEVITSDLPDGIELDDLDFDRLAVGETITGSAGRLVFAAAPTESTGGGLVIVLANEPGSVTRPVFRWFLLASAVTLGLGLLVARSLGRRVAAPIRDARDATQRIAAGDFTARALPEHTRDNDELADLARSIDSMAESLERGRGLERQFLLSVSHDLRTPMTSILGYAEALQDGAVDDPAAAGAVIAAESRRLDRLVRDLLDLAKLQSRRFTLHVGDHDLAELVDEVAAGFEPALGERQITLSIHQPDEPIVAAIDRDRAGQVLANLVENASRYARGRIDIAVTADDAWAVVTVRDDGPGIDATDLPHVFERLYVARHDPVAAETGSGLGLAIVNELVEAMGGRVDVTSPPGLGASFTVWLPRR